MYEGLVGDILSQSELLALQDSEGSIGAHLKYECLDPISGYLVMAWV